MDSSGNLSTMVFKRVVRSDMGEISLDSQTLNVLMQFDGEKDLESVIYSLNMPPAAIKKALLRLTKLNLIEPNSRFVPLLDKHFLSYLSEQLSLAMGPIAEILIDDEIGDMELEKERVPIRRAAELVEALARKIPREEKRNDFRRKMLEKIKGI